MALDLVDYESLARLGVAQFWNGRSTALENEDEPSQGGERRGVLGGKNLDGFLAMVQEIVHKNGLPSARVCIKGRPSLTLPGFFRARKLWDVLVLDRGKLVAAVEFKSHVGPSFGNNFNNRAEEAIGTAHDLWTAIRENSLGDQSPPFVGWIILVEDCPKSRIPVKGASPHFPVFPEFQGASCLERYNILCQRLINEGLYSQASVIASPRSSRIGGHYLELSHSTGLRAFAARLAAHVAGWSALYPE